MNVDQALAIADDPRKYTHNEQVIARIILAAAVRTTLSMCEVWAAREPDCAGVRAIRDELKSLGAS